MGDVDNAISTFLPRVEEKKNLIQFLTHFSEHASTPTIKRGIYVRGGVGVGKTMFVTQTLKECGYNIILFDAGELRNKSVFDSMSHRNLASVNVMEKFHQRTQPTAIIIDEIDGMNSGDKGGLNALIKLIRPKKTKKQRSEGMTMNPVICIGNHVVDKKINELLKVCEILDFPNPPKEQIKSIFRAIVPNATDASVDNISGYVQSDLRKLCMVCRLYTYESADTLVVALKLHTNSAKTATNKLMHGHYSIQESAHIVNETDRTIVGYLLHENTTDILYALPPTIALRTYISFLNNICYADYIDRVTFQKQVWKFTELSAITKICTNARLIHDAFESAHISVPVLPEIRFTKVLTKYSTEYSNYGFLQSLCQRFGWDLDDLFCFFAWFCNQLDYVKRHVCDVLAEYDVEPLDVKRMVRFMNKYINVVTPEKHCTTEECGDEDLLRLHMRAYDDELEYDGDIIDCEEML